MKGMPWYFLGELKKSTMIIIECGTNFLVNRLVAVLPTSCSRILLAALRAEFDCPISVL
jgi:hypothetical protein